MESRLRRRPKRILEICRGGFQGLQVLIDDFRRRHRGYDEGEIDA